MTVDTLRHRTRRAGGVLKQAWRAFRDGAAVPAPDHHQRVLPRYGYGKPAHGRLLEIIGRDRDAYRARLESFLSYKEDLLRIPLDPENAESPHWNNIYFCGLDAVALYGLLASTNPARYVEVGSGNSTKFARRAIRDHGLRTRITSIDPAPRQEVDAICDRVIRAPLEDADLTVFDEIESGDIVFFDGSHQALPNSDVTVAFLEVLPRLPSGTLVEFHDITIPWDYPQFFIDMRYSEQYMLAAHLLAHPAADIVLPNWFISTTPELHHVLDPIWDQFTWSASATNGLSFWMRVSGAR